MFKKHSIFLAFVLALSINALMGSCSKKDGSEDDKIIPVGQYGSLTGSEATFGLSTKQGIEIATDEVNAAGGIKGKKIKMFVMDDRGQPEEATAVVTRLITQHKVVAVLGEVASSRSLAAAPIAQANKIPLITPASTNPEVTKVGNYIFRTCFIDPFQGYVVAKFARENLKLKRVAILRDKKSDYSEGLANVFRDEFKRMGGTIVLDLGFQSGDVEYKPQLNSIKGKTPDGIFIPGYYSDVALIARQTRELGMKIPLLGGDGWDSARLFEVAGKALPPAYISNHYAPEAGTPELKAFLATYQTRYGNVPDAMAVLGYDAAKILYAAMARTENLKPDEIRDQIALTRNFPGVSGKISLNADRNADKPAVVLNVMENGYKYETTIAPPEATDAAKR